MVVPEWLSGMTRNHVGFARAGSNPADHAFYHSAWHIFFFSFQFCFKERELFFYISISSKQWTFSLFSILLQRTWTLFLGVLSNVKIVNTYFSISLKHDISLVFQISHLKMVLRSTIHAFHCPLPLISTFSFINISTTSLAFNHPFFHYISTSNCPTDNFEIPHTHQTNLHLSTRYYMI